MNKQEKAREARLKKKYGITIAQYEQMLRDQDYKCALCRKHHAHFKNRLHVDHNHKSKRVRGLVCFYCNHQLIRRHNYKTAKDLLCYFTLYDPGS